jgi:hypothetical protein
MFTTLHKSSLVSFENENIFFCSVKRSSPLPTTLALHLSGSTRRVARGFIFKPKIQIWVNLESLKMENVDIFYDPLEYCSDI